MPKTQWRDNMSTSTRHIVVEPKSSLFTERLKIAGDGFGPNESITVRATVECKKEKFSFYSYGHYLTTVDGEFDLSTCESLGGTYTGVDAMGLLWSMLPVRNSISRLHVNDASLSKIYTFFVIAGHTNDTKEETQLCQTSIERHYICENIKRTKIKIGDFDGTLFMPPVQGQFGAIMTIYGFNKRKKAIEDAAAIFVNFGFITLTVQYYGTENTPKLYSDAPIELERFEACVDYLLSLDNCHSVGVWGTSKGGEIAIAMASHLPKVRAVTCVNGHISSVGTPTTYKEKIYPPISTQFDHIKVFPNGDANVLNVLIDPEEEPSTIHPIENSSATLLWIVSLDDYHWKSERYAEIARKRMEAVGKTNYEIFKCAGMGHLVDAPFMPVCSSEKHPISPNKDMKVYYGGGGENKPLHAAGQESVWHKVISFFKDSLNPSSKL